MDALAAAAPDIISAFNIFAKYFLFEFVYHLGATWVLPLKRPWTYWASFAVIQFTGYAVIAAGAPMGIRFIWFIMSFALLPYLCWDAPRGLRVAAAAMLTISELLIEAVAMVWYISPDSAPIVQGGPSPHEASMRVTNTALMAALALMIRLFIGRARLVSGGRGSRAKGNAGSGVPAGLERFNWFFIIQLLSLSALLIALFNTGVHYRQLPLVFLTIAMAVVSIAADATVVLSMKRHLAAERSRARTASLAERLETHAEASRRILAESDDAARFRHDERNHLAVLSSLIDTGQTERARTYIADLRSRNAGRGASAASDEPEVHPPRSGC